MSSRVACITGWQKGFPTWGQFACHNCAADSFSVTVEHRQIRWDARSRLLKYHCLILTRIRISAMYNISLIIKDADTIAIDMRLCRGIRKKTNGRSQPCNCGRLCRPMDILNEIAGKWFLCGCRYTNLNTVLLLLIRFVYCPSYPSGGMRVSEAHNNNKAHCLPIITPCFSDSGRPSLILAHNF